MTEEEYQIRIHELEKQVTRLQSEIKRNSETNYGLRWMDVPEAFDAESENKIPTLEEVKELAINNNDGKPTHILIEGDNYHALTCLNYTHKGKIDVIYIDPPYNTGSDGFVYKDKRILDKFPDGTTVPTDHPLRHSYWLSFMEKRLRLAKNLLSKTGVIFISIDDNEMANLKILSDKVFGENNMVSSFIWEKHKAPKNDNLHVTINHEYILCYAKNISYVHFNKYSRTEKNLKSFKNPDNDPRGVWTSGPLLAPTYSQSTVFEIIAPNGKAHVPPVGKCWSFNKEGIQKLLDDNRIWFGQSGNNVPRIKRFLSELEDSIGITSMFSHDVVGGTQRASNELITLFSGKKIFPFPKPVKLISNIQNISSSPSSVILDFFAGSGTTLHATMLLNQEDGGHRQCILVQSPDSTWEINKNGEKIAKKGCEVAFQLGYNKISEITYDRGRRVIRGYKDKNENEIAGIGNSLKFYRTSFVGEHTPSDASDFDKTLLAQKAGCLLALSENNLEEIVTAHSYQIFALRDGDKATNDCKYTAVYFSGNLMDFPKLRQEIEQLQAQHNHPKIAIYVFCWGDASIMLNEFDDTNNLVVKDIPQPILDIYTKLNA